LNTAGFIQSNYTKKEIKTSKVGDSGTQYNPNYLGFRDSEDLHFEASLGKKVNETPCQQINWVKVISAMQEVKVGGSPINGQSRQKIQDLIQNKTKQNKKLMQNGLGAHLNW
jgi:hypothetical protein